VPSPAQCSSASAFSVRALACLSRLAAVVRLAKPRSAPCEADHLATASANGSFRNEKDSCPTECPSTGLMQSSRLGAVFQPLGTRSRRGADRVDKQWGCPEGELRGQATLVKITVDVRKYAENALDETVVLDHGLRRKAAEFQHSGAEIYSKPRRMEPTGTRRHRLEFTASPRRAKMMGISFVKLCRRKAPRVPVSAVCAARTSVPCASLKMSVATPPNKV
jgi:hypothetical protein